MHFTNTNPRAGDAGARQAICLDNNEPAINSRQTDLPQAALNYAACEIPVFPCQPRSKVPAVRRGFHAATTNPETVKRFWRVSDNNVAIPTGTISGIWILDVDGTDGESSLQDLESLHGRIPQTREVITGRGRHLWFVCDRPMQSSAGRLGAGLDVKADNACCTVPPSVHESGRIYRWSGADHVAVAPSWLGGLARKRPKPTLSERAIFSMRGRSTEPGQDCHYGQAALRSEITSLAGSPAGSRNHALNRSAFALFQLVGGGELDERQVVEHLVDACHCNGLISDDGMNTVAATIESARAGLKFPRSRCAERRP